MYKGERGRVRCVGVNPVGRYIYKGTWLIKPKLLWDHHFHRDKETSQLIEKKMDKACHITPRRIQPYIYEYCGPLALTIVRIPRRQRALRFIKVSVDGVNIDSGSSDRNLVRRLF